MDAKELWAGNATWAAKNLAYNLDFIPDDKLDWKPAPTANSALEIVHHTVEVFTHIIAMLQAAKSGAELPEASSLKKPTTREEAKKEIIAAAESYVGFLQTVSSDDLEKSVDSPFGKMPFGFMASIPSTDIIHHHGQIAYIQTLLGDAEPHFDMSLMPS